MDQRKLSEPLWCMHLEHMRVLEYVVEQGCTRGENGLLMYLYHIGEPMFAGELTEKLGLTTGRTANILRVLEREGLVTRETDSQDKRRVLVKLTPEGEKKAEKLIRRAIEFQERVMSFLEPEEADQFLKSLMRLLERVEDELF